MAADRYKYFRIEARELVDGLAQGLLDLEKSAEAELVSRLLRLAHTLKGAARIVKHRELAELSHTLEDMLAPLREAPVPTRLDAAIALVDQMSAHVTALPSATPKEEPAPAIPSAKPIEPLATMPRVDAAAIDEVLGGLGEIHAMIERLRALSDPRELTRGLEYLEREVRGVRYDAEQLRLLPVRAMFPSLERTARDSALANGKRVEVIGRGGDVRLDGQALGALHGPLVQLVRNAVAHGIEAPAARLAANKPAEGRIEIDVRLHGGLAIVTCRDDGRGIDYDAVRREAQKRGHTGELSEPVLLSMLLRGGISTSAVVSELAGRGIGLDVVRAAVVELGGEITATSQRGGGTTFTLAVPASRAAVSALVVESAGRLASIPLSAIRRVSQLAERDLTSTPEHRSVAYDDVALPFASLDVLFGGSYRAHATMIVVEAGGSLAALGVDRTRGVEDVVVRVTQRVPLDPIIWGIALDAEGLPRPVLEPTALVAAIQRAPVAVEHTTARALPILVVDDSLTTRMLEQSILESAGYTVEVATSGEEALDRIARTAYGLVLVDVEMPGMDGFTVISTLRGRADTAELPAILVTSRNAPEDLRRGVEVGANGYVVKSEFDQVELLALIGKLVRA